MATLGKTSYADKMGGGLEAQNKADGFVRPGVNWKFECVRDGETMWEEEWHNLVTNSGLIYMLSVGLSNSAAITAPWYVGLIQTGMAAAAADTFSSHAGWTDFSNYAESAHQLWVGGTPDQQGEAGNHETSNSASKAAFTIRGAATTAVGGAFLARVATMSGNVGILYAVGTFDAGDRTGLQAGDTLNVTATMSAVTG